MPDIASSTVELDARKLLPRIVLEVRISHLTEVKWRLVISLWLIRLARWVGGYQVDIGQVDIGSEVEQDA